MASIEATPNQSPIERDVVEVLRALPPERQREVLDFADFLRQRNHGKQARRSVRGLWKDLGVTITDEDIAEARRDFTLSFQSAAVAGGAHSGGCGKVDDARCRR